MILPNSRIAGPTSSTEPGSADPTFPTEPGNVSLTGLTKAQAEVVLDRLDAHGCHDREIRYIDGEGFTIQFRQRSAVSWALLSRWRCKTALFPTHTAEVA